MKTIGLIGGMSWESTVTYYQLANRLVRERLGGLHSAKIILYSVDFHEIEHLQSAGDWKGAGEELAKAALALERAGADLLLICTNTMHKVAAETAAPVSIPLLHIADATAEAVKARGIGRIGLLGTSYTMVDDFYKGVLQKGHGLEVLIPEEPDLGLVHDVIYNELCLGKILPESRHAYQRIITDLAARGAQGVILGCTEIGLLVDAKDCPIPVFDTTAIHVQKAVDQALL